MDRSGGAGERTIIDDEFAGNGVNRDVLGGGAPSEADPLLRRLPSSHCFGESSAIIYFSNQPKRECAHGHSWFPQQ